MVYCCFCHLWLVGTSCIKGIKEYFRGALVPSNFVGYWWIFSYSLNNVTARDHWSFSVSHFISFSWFCLFSFEISIYVSLSQLAMSSCNFHHLSYYWGPFLMVVRISTLKLQFWLLNIKTDTCYLSLFPALTWGWAGASYGPVYVLKRNIECSS